MGKKSFCTFRKMVSTSGGLGKNTLRNIRKQVLGNYQTMKNLKNDTNKHIPFDVNSED